MQTDYVLQTNVTHQAYADMRADVMRWMVTIGVREADPAIIGAQGPTR